MFALRFTQENRVEPGQRFGHQRECHEQRKEANERFCEHEKGISLLVDPLMTSSSKVVDPKGLTDREDHGDRQGCDRKDDVCVHQVHLHHVEVWRLSQM